MREYTHAGDYLLRDEKPTIAEIQEMYPRGKVKRFHGHNAFTAHYEFGGDGTSTKKPYSKTHFISYWTEIATHANTGRQWRVINVKVDYDSYSKTTTRQLERWIFETVTSDFFNANTDYNYSRNLAYKVLNKLYMRKLSVGKYNNPKYIQLQYRLDTKELDASVISARDLARCSHATYGKLPN